MKMKKEMIITMMRMKKITMLMMKMSKMKIVMTDHLVLDIKVRSRLAENLIQTTSKISTATTI